MLEDETTVPALFAAAVAAHGDADAIDDAATRATTYSELASAVAAAAARLSSALGAAADTYLLFNLLIFFHSSPTSHGTSVLSPIVIISLTIVMPSMCLPKATEFKSLLSL